MNIRLKKMMIQNFRRIENMELSFGNKLTIIVGHNGTGKSNLLSLITAGTGTPVTSFHKNGDKVLGKLQPNYSEYFKIDSKIEPIDDYSIYSQYQVENESFIRRLSFKDDNRSYHIVPRVSNKYPFINETGKLCWRKTDDSLKNASLRLNESFGFKIGDSGRLPLATQYISVSRLIPRGESDYTSIKKKSFPLSTKKLYREWYNSVLLESIDTTSDIFNINKDTEQSAKYEMAIKNTPQNSISVGQDSLNSIISALINYELISQDEQYLGGVLAIDEIDMSLHPAAQIKLIELLDDLADKLNIQIFMTTHSLSAVKYFEKLSKKRPTEDYSIVYIKDRFAPFSSPRNSYKEIASDMALDGTVVKPKTKLYAEDDSGYKMLKLLVQSINLINDEKKINLINLDDFEIIPAEIGKTQLKHLNEIDRNFQASVIVLDGDSVYADDNKSVTTKAEYINGSSTLPKSNFKPHKPNIVAMPGGFAPEALIYHLLNRYTENTDQISNQFWREIDIFDRNPGMWNRTYVKSNIIVPDNRLSTDYLKDHLKDLLFKFAEETYVIQYWLKTDSCGEELSNQFIVDIKKAQQIASSKSNSYLI